jgi:hypothetical protein
MTIRRGNSIIAGNQNYIFDITPTSGSTNPVTSNGIYEALEDKQDTLVSGTNIKTINNESILGNGNITISGGGSDVEEYSIAEIEALWNGESE